MSSTRSFRRDVLPALALFVVAEVESALTGEVLPFFFALPVFTLGLAWRRSHAFELVVASSVAVFVSETIEPAEWNAMASIFAFLFVAFSAAAHEPLRRAVAGLTVMLGSLVLGEAVQPGGESDVVFAVVIFGGAWLAGRGVRARRVQAERLADVGARLVAEREANAALAVNEERLRVARDLHDSVAGLIGVMVVQAGAAQAAPDRAAGAIAAIRSAGRDATRELGTMLRALGGGVEGEPQPGLDRLDELVAFARSAGVRVDLEVSQERPLPPGLELSAYRIVQEALTNVVKHAGGARTTVRLRYDDDALRIEVVDDGAPESSDDALAGGHGLRSMRERAALFGGDLEVGVRPDGGFRVRARLPIT